MQKVIESGVLGDLLELEMHFDYYRPEILVSVKSSYFRVKERPSFVVYGKKGCFEKTKKDRQEEHLKLFYMPDNPDFGLDLPEHYGTLYYYDDNKGLK